MKSINSKYTYWVIFIIGIIILSFIQYYGLIHFHYAVPPGDDGANHLSMTMTFYENSTTILESWKSGSYPPGYHIFLAKTAHLFNVEPLRVMLWTYPSLLFFSGLVIFFLAYVIFGPTIALLTFYVYSFTTRTPIQLLNDGGYPNLIAAHILLPLTIAFFILANRSKKKYRVVYSLLSILSALLLIFTHHISTFYFIGIILLFVPTYYLASAIFLKKKVREIIWPFMIYIVSLFVLLIVYKKSDVLAPARNLGSIMFESIDHFPYFKSISNLSDPGAIFSPREYPARIGKLVVPIGFFSIFYIPFILKKELKEYLLPISILFCWTILLLIGSRLTFLTNPERMARDLAVPLSILSAAALYYFWQKAIKFKKYKSLAICIFLFVLAFLVYSPTRDRFKNAFNYEPMVRFTDADKEATRNLIGLNDKTMLVYSYDWFMPYLIKNIGIQNAYAVDISNRFNPEYVDQFDYVYIVDSQTGWAPESVQFGLATSFMNPRYQLISNVRSATNNVYLFKRIR